MFDNVSLLSLQLHLNGLVFDRNIFGSSSVVFGNLWLCSENDRKCSENARKRSSGLWNNLGKSSEIFGKWSEIFGKSSKTARLYNKKKITRYDITCEDISTRYFTRSLRSLVRYRVEHSKIKFISTCWHVISSKSIHVGVTAVRVGTYAWPFILRDVRLHENRWEIKFIGLCMGNKIALIYNAKNFDSVLWREEQW